MRSWIVAVAVIGAVLAFGPAPSAAQAEEEPGELELVYEREVYTYEGDARRDPFRPLTDDGGLGPRFESLSLRAIIYSTGRDGSLALLTDAEDRVYRVRVGDVVGNAQVLEIGPLRVILAVENFGTIRQEMLELPTRRGSGQ